MGKDNTKPVKISSVFVLFIVSIFCYSVWLFGFSFCKPDDFICGAFIALPLMIITTVIGSIFCIIGFIKLNKYIKQKNTKNRPL